MDNEFQITESMLAAQRRKRIKQDGLYLVRYLFKKRFGIKMIIAPHHLVIWETLERVYSGEIKRLIINVPPSFTKTELCVIGFIEVCIARNNMAKFMHLSFSDALVLENSEIIKEAIESEAYQNMWHVPLKKDSKSKKKWWTEQRGGMYATAAGGTVTGFRAGHMKKGFQGAIIIDDATKPDDVETVERMKVNRRFNGTIASRTASRDTPIIVIGQRLHKMDLSGYLLRGGSGEDWHHLNLPVLIDNKKLYPKEYKKGIEIKHGLPDGALWPEKKNLADIELLRKDRAVFNSQYMQAPELTIVMGSVCKETWIEKNRIDSSDLPELTEIVIAVDPSGDDGIKKGEADDEGNIKKSDSDEIGIVIAGRCKKGHFYILKDSSMNGSPLQWAKQTVRDYHNNGCNALVWEANYGGAMVKSTIMSIKGGEQCSFRKVTASKGKKLRAEPASALYENNFVHHVGSFNQLEDELTQWDGKGKSPNRLDAVVWAIIHLSKDSGGEQTAPAHGVF